MRTSSAPSVAVLGLALILSAVAAPPDRAVAASPAPAGGRLAFTDARDVVQQVDLEAVEDADGRPYLVPSGGPSAVEALGRHSGQARGDSGYWQQSTQSYAFVSTRPSDPAPAPDDPSGQVWYSVGPAVAPVRVTDDDSRKSHPQAWLESSDCLYGTARVDVAYASDRSGNWDIWVATLQAESIGDSAGTCGPFEVIGVHRVTDDPGDDLWPEWDWDSPDKTRSLVFSSTRSDPRGDLYRVEVPPGEPTDDTQPADLPITQLTSGPEADSAPAPRPRTEFSQSCSGDPEGGEVEPRWLAFTRASDDDPRGSLAVLDLDDPGGGVLSLGVPASTEADWSPDGRFIAYRSTAEDPDGDVLVGRFERTCPPDLAVVSVTTSPEPAEAGSRVGVTITVRNLGSEPVSGELEVRFPRVLENPFGCVERVCSLTVPTLGAGQWWGFWWGSISEVPPSNVTVVGAAPVAADLGTGEITATVGVDGPVADGVPGNDTVSTPVAVGVDVQFAPVLDSEGAVLDPDGVTANPSALNFAGEDGPLGTEVRLLVHNPGPVRVDVILAVESDNPLAVSDGSQRVTRALTVEPNTVQDPLVKDFGFSITRPEANTTITFSASVTVVPPVIDPDPSNNTGAEGVELSNDFIESTLGGTSDAPLGVSPVTHAVRITDGLHRGPAGAAVIPGSAESALLASVLPAGAVPTTAVVPAGAAPLAAVPAAVPAPTKPEVDDSVALAQITAVSRAFGVAESHPTFTYTSDGQLRLLLTWRPAGSRVSDVVSSDGTDRRVLAEDPTSQVAMGHPSYSPDGRFVAYHRSTCDRIAAPPSLGAALAASACILEGSEIVVAGADGTDPIVIEAASQPRPDGARDLRPAWAPDGSAIAFTRIEPPSPVTSGTERVRSALWVSSGLDLAVAPPDLVADTTEQLTTPHLAAIAKREIDEFDDEAAWSPDGSRIAFTRARLDTSDFWDEVLVLPDFLDPGDYDSDIWLIDVATGDEQPLLAVEVGADGGACPEVAATDDTGTVCPGGDDRGADWSPDGTRVVYEHTGWLYLADPDARSDLGPVTGPRVLDPSDSLPLYPDDPADPSTDPDDPLATAYPDLDWAQDPAWSVDGDRVAFAGQLRGQPDQRGIHWLTVPDDLADRQIRQVADQPQPEVEPDWQPTADLALTMTSAPASVASGVPSQVTATVTNEGPGHAIGAEVELALPAGLTAGTLPASCVGASPISCSLGDLAAGSVATVTLPVSGAPEGTYAIPGETSSRTVDPDPADNTASTSVVVTPQPTADLAITLTAVPASVSAGVTSQVTASVTNGGPGTATSAVVALNLPIGLTAGPLPAGCSAGPPITCTLGNLASGATADVVLPVSGALAGTYTVTGETSSLTVDPDPANNTASVSIAVTQEADLSVTVQIDPVPGYVGGEQTVTLTLVNAGPVASAATVVVQLPEGSGAPEGEECVTTAGCSIAEIAPFQVVTRTIPLTPEAALSGRAVATITGPFPDPDPANNTDRARIRVLQPTMAFSPSLGEPGRVSMLMGIDFPPNGRVGLKWDDGLLNFRVPIRVGADGTFQVPILALRRDRLGPRRMGAARVSGEEFAEVFADYLVVPRTQFPPDFNGRG